jgi:PAS domain S-box-containing protein
VRRLDGLQAATAALSAAVTPSDVARVVLDEAIAMLGAQFGTVSLIGEGGRLERLDARGSSEELLRASETLSPAALPAAEAARTGRAVWLASPGELRARDPALEALAARAGMGALAAIALVVRGRPIGVLSLAFQAPRRFGKGDRTFAAALADACALALERARLFESERRLRTSAEVTASLLQDFDQFRLLVDQVKDYAIFMLDPSGNVRTWNRGAERIKGYRADEIVGTHFSRFYRPEDSALGQPALALADTPEPVPDLQSSKFRRRGGYSVAHLHFQRDHSQGPTAPVRQCAIVTPRAAVGMGCVLGPEDHAHTSRHIL